MRKVWVTRTQPGALKSAGALKAAGYDPIIAPLLEIMAPEILPPPPPRDAVLIVTSQNALNGLAKLTVNRHWPLICVGDATADLARDYGFEAVHSAQGTSKDVTAYVKDMFDKDRSVIWHLGGNNVRGTIVEDLLVSGFSAKRHIIYISQPIQNIPKIDFEEIDCVLLYSPLTAKTLRDLGVKTAHMTAISLSEAVDVELNPLSFKGRYIASEPTEIALIRALDCAP